MKDISPGNPVTEEANVSRGSGACSALLSITAKPSSCHGSIPESAHSPRSYAMLEYGGKAWPPSDVSIVRVEWWKISVSTVTLFASFPLGVSRNDESKRPPPGEVEDEFLAELWRRISHINAVSIDSVLRGDPRLVEFGLTANADCTKV